MSFEYPVCIIICAYTYLVFYSRKPSSPPWPEFLPGSLLSTSWLCFLSVLIMCVHKYTDCFLSFVFLITVKLTPSWALSLHLYTSLFFTPFLVSLFSLLLGCCLQHFLPTSVFSLTVPLVFPTPLCSFFVFIWTKKKRPLFIAIITIVLLLLKLN